MTDPVAAAAADLLDVLDPEQRARAAGSLEDPDLRVWTYLPGDRPGLRLADLTEEQRRVALKLLRVSHSEAGARTALGAIEVERIRRELVGGVPVTGDRYWLRVLGDPRGDRPWGWRINGHHLAVHAILAGGRMSLTPHFIGAEPAEVREGPATGRRLLAPEEDLARELLHSLGAGQRKQAVFSATPPRDILTRADPVAEPGRLPDGLRYDRLEPDQQSLLQALVRRYLDRTPEREASRLWATVVEDGLDRLAFAWAGGFDRGDRHYYCVTGPGLVIEYDNTQDGGNHAHSVWRDLRDDWGVDLLRRHYEKAHA